MAKESEIYFIEYGDPIEAAEKGVDQSITEALAEIVTNAKLLCPVYPQMAKKVDPKRTGGRLRNSIMSSGPKGDYGRTDGPRLDATGKKGVGYVGSAVDYAPYVELGTRKMAAQPYIRPAIALQQGKSVAFIKETMNQYMKRFTEQAQRKVKWRKRKFTDVKF